jgi:hypothetical protein
MSDTTSQIDLLTAQNEALAAQVAELTEQLAGLTSKVESGNSATVVTEAPKGLAKPEPFEVGKKLYRFKYASFVIGDTKYITSEVEADKALRESLVKEYPSIVDEV